MNNPIPLLSEKFELLSAYLDGEVTPTERQQVEDWLASDVELQHTYQQILTLQGGLKSIPTKVSIPTEQLVHQVMRRLDRQPNRWVWGGVGAATALLIGTISGLLTGNPTGTLRMAQQSKQPTAVEIPQPTVSTTVAMSAGESINPRALMIVLEHPPVEIPVVPVSTRSYQGDSGL